MKKTFIINIYTKRFLAAFTLITLLPGCSTISQHSASIPLPPQQQTTAHHLLLRDDIVISNNQTFTIKDKNILQLNQDIIDLIKQHKIEKIRDPRKRFQVLSHLLLDKNKLNLQYDESTTKTAIETFQTKSANCLSFSNLFVAMARYINLPARYQQVSVPPNWNKEGNTMIMNNHINVLTKLKHYRKVFSKGRLGSSMSSSPILINSHRQLPGLEVNNSLVADFDPSAGLMRYSSKIIEDDHAKALYYSNIGVEFLLENKIPEAYMHIKKAIQIYPKASSPWNNLGNIYKRLKHFELAEKVYLHAIQLDNNQLTAVSNLVRLYQYLSADEKATPYLRYLEEYRNNNPYYHFELGQRAIATKSYTKASNHFRKAIRLKDNEDTFYVSLATTYYKRGMYKKAVASMKKARRYAHKEAIRNLYSKKIKILSAY